MSQGREVALAAARLLPCPVPDFLCTLPPSFLSTGKHHQYLPSVSLTLHAIIQVLVYLENHSSDQENLPPSAQPRNHIERPSESRLKTSASAKPVHSFVLLPFVDSLHTPGPTITHLYASTWKSAAFGDLSIAIQRIRGPNNSRQGSCHQRDGDGSREERTTSESPHNETCNLHSLSSRVFANIA